MPASTDPHEGDATPDPRLPIQRSEEAMAMFRHDLMTPINLILGYTEMLEEDLTAQGKGKVPADLQKVKLAARKLMELIEENTRPPQAAGQPQARPKAEPPALEKPAAPPVVDPGPDTDTECFLVVDDQEENRDLLTRLLRKEGYACQTATNGREALDLLLKRPFDMVLLDAMMPEMNGFELLHRLKQDDALKHVPVIMISAFTELERTAECIKQGAEDYLPKPFNSTLLLARVAACLEKKRSRDREQRIYQALAESQQALATELHEAAAHVRSLLPAPLQGDVRTDWRFVPSMHLGGDAFGYFPLDQDRLALFLLDVCGHGVAAALHSISVMNTIRARALPDVDFGDPGSVLAGLNNRFQMSEHNNMYFTIWYGVYQRSTRQMAYASAGHPPAVLISQDELGPCVRKLITGGPIIGMLPDLPFKTTHHTVPADARLFVFSDGAYELKRTEGGMLEFADFVDALATAGAADASALDQVMDFARKTQGGEAFEDDLSIVKVDF
jgi:phosphoserine phosphatase RsbU/P